MSVDKNADRQGRRTLFHGNTIAPLFLVFLDLLLDAAIHISRQRADLATSRPPRWGRPIACSCFRQHSGLVPGYLRRPCIRLARRGGTLGDTPPDRPPPRPPDPLHHSPSPPR